MIPRQADQLFTEIKTLPPRERLRLVERVIHDLTDGGDAEPAPGDPGAILGLFADAPELMDEISEAAMVARERDPLRGRDA
jgi:hypothetical protein